MKIGLLLSLVLSLTACKTLSSRDKLSGENGEESDSPIMIEPRIEMAVNFYRGSLSGVIKRDTFFFSDKKRFVMHLKKFDRPDSDGRVAEMTLNIEGHTECKKPAFIGYDNDAYPINGKNSITMEVSGCENLFRVVVALPDPTLEDTLNYDAIDTIVDIQSTNETARKVYKGVIHD